MPPGWSICEVCIERMTVSLSIRWAMLGISSQIRMPGRLVAMSRIIPPVGRPIFMSKVSNWLAPPLSQIKMQCFFFFLTSWALASDWNKIAPIHHRRPARRGEGTFQQRPTADMLITRTIHRGHAMLHCDF